MTFNFQIKKFAKQSLQKHLDIDESEITDDSTSGKIHVSGKVYTVKTSNPVAISTKKTFQIWDFDVRGDLWQNGRNRKIERSADVDYFVLIGMEKNVPKKCFLMPIADAPKSHVRISVAGSSKYHQYAI